MGRDFHFEGPTWAELEGDKLCEGELLHDEDPAGRASSKTLHSSTLMLVDNHYTEECHNYIM